MTRCATEHCPREAIGGFSFYSEYCGECRAEFFRWKAEHKAGKRREETARLDAEGMADDARTREWWERREESA